MNRLLILLGLMLSVSCAAQDPSRAKIEALAVNYIQAKSAISGCVEITMSVSHADSPTEVRCIKSEGESGSVWILDNDRNELLSSTPIELLKVGDELKETVELSTMNSYLPISKFLTLTIATHFQNDGSRTCLLEGRGLVLVSEYIEAISSNKAMSEEMMEIERNNRSIIKSMQSWCK